MPAPPIFRYAERRPEAALLPWIRNFWMFEVGPSAPPVHHVPPDGCTSLVMHLNGAPSAELMVSGPWLAPLAVPVAIGDRYGGARFQPGAAPLLLGVPSTSLRDRVRPAAPLLGFRARAIEEALFGVRDIDALADRLTPALEELVRGRAEPGPPVSSAAQRLLDSGGQYPLATLASELGVSERTMRRKFAAEVGVSPKQFARIRRLFEAAWQVVGGNESWSRVAHGVGYADQPHLNRDVTDLTGLTPGALRSRIRSTQHDEVVP